MKSWILFDGELTKSSTNGTWLNIRNQDVKTKFSELQLLEHDDELKIGDS